MATTTVDILLKANAAQASAEFNAFIQKATGGFKMLASLGATLLGTYSVVSGVKDIAKLGGDLDDISKQTQVAVKELAILNQAFEDASLGAGAVSPTLAKMQDNLVSAAKSGGPVAAALERINLRAEELLKLAPDEQFRSIGERIAAIENPSLRTATAIDIFGKSGNKLLTLFADGGALSNAEKFLGTMPKVLERNSTLLDSISDSISGLGVRSKQFFLGVLDQIGGLLRKGFDFIEGIDLTPIGQKVGAFINIVVDFWNEGKIDELISLTIQAGFEIGTAQGKKVWQALVEWLSSSGLWKGVANVVMSFGVQVGKMAVQLLADILTTIVSLIIKGADEIRVAFQKLGNFLKEIFALAVNDFAAKLESIINGAINAANKLPGVNIASRVSFGRVSESTTAPDRAMTMAEAFATVAENMAWSADAVKKFFDDSLQQSREILGVTRSEGSAVEALTRLIAAKVKQREDEANAANKTTRAQGSQILQLDDMRRLRELETAAKNRLLAIERERAMVDASYTTTDADKYNLRKSLLIQERDILASLVAQLRLRAEMNGLSVQEREHILARADSYQDKLSSIDAKLMGLGPDPNSLSQQISASLTDVYNQFGTISQQIARMFSGTILTAVNSVSDGITGVIMGTKSWGDALTQIRLSIAQEIVHSIVQMGVQWLTTHVFMKGISAGFSAFLSMLRGKEAAETIATETTKTPVLATNAAFASVSSYGGALAAVGVLAALVAAFSGAFAEGGRPEPGKVALVGERGPELFIPDSSGTIIPNNQIGDYTSGSPASVSPQQSHPPVVHVVTVRDPNQVREYIESKVGSDHIIRIVKSNMNELGGRA